MRKRIVLIMAIACILLITGCGADFCLEMQDEETGERMELDEVIFEYYSM